MSIKVLHIFKQIYSFQLCGCMCELAVDTTKDLKNQKSVFNVILDLTWRWIQNCVKQLKKFYLSCFYGSWIYLFNMTHERCWNDCCVEIKGVGMTVLLKQNAHHKCMTILSPDFGCVYFYNFHDF